MGKIIDRGRCARLRLSLGIASKGYDGRRGKDGKDGRERRGTEILDLGTEVPLKTIRREIAALLIKEEKRAVVQDGAAGKELITAAIVRCHRPDGLSGGLIPPYIHPDDGTQRGLVGRMADLPVYPEIGTDEAYRPEWHPCLSHAIWAGIHAEHHRACSLAQGHPQVSLMVIPGIGKHVIRQDRALGDEGIKAGRERAIGR